MAEALGLALGFLCFMVGASIFSFLNVVAYRSVKGENFVKGRSYCPSCGHELSFMDMLPVFSYIFLLGKCRYCKNHIPVKDTVFEIIGGFLLLASIYKAVAVTGFNLMDSNTDIYYEVLLRVIFMFLFFMSMDVISLIDMDTMEIRNISVVTLFVIAVLSAFIMPEITIADRLIGMVVISLPMLIIALIIPGGFGGGDIKLMAAGGAFLGWKLILVGFFIALLSGGLWGVYLLITKKADRKAHFAFGPFLCAGMSIALLWGEDILNAYLGLLMY
ncbi:MAG: prepilin peptidase [Butyrivibrio sp.]|nr:prepilin peptidase [Butyrivibrio sp.]